MTSSPVGLIAQLAAAAVHRYPEVMASNPVKPKFSHAFISCVCNCDDTSCLQTLAVTCREREEVKGDEEELMTQEQNEKGKENEEEEEEDMTRMKRM